MCASMHTCVCVCVCEWIDGSIDRLMDGWMDGLAEADSTRRIQLFSQKNSPSIQCEHWVFQETCTHMVRKRVSHPTEMCVPFRKTWRVFPFPQHITRYLTIPSHSIMKHELLDERHKIPSPFNNCSFILVFIS